MKHRRTDPPDDLTWCVKCRRVIGPRGGWQGPECQCGLIDYERAARNAHSI